MTLIPITIPGVSASATFNGPQTFGTPQPIKATAALGMVFTGTWTSDTNSDNAAPTSVKFSVQSSANGSYTNNGSAVQAGLADDGYGDPFDPNAPTPSTSHTPTVRYRSSDPKTLSLTLTLSASATGTPGTRGGASASTTAGPFTIFIHAQPYKFRSSGYDLDETYYNKSVQDNTNAILALSYIWSSTDGIQLPSKV